MTQAIDLGPASSGIDLGPVDLGSVEENSNLSLTQMGKNALGGLAAAGQFAASAVSMPLAGLYGLGKGAYESLIEDKPFLSSTVEGIEGASDYMDVGRSLGARENSGYKAATEVFETPVQAGIQSMRGLSALSQLPVYGLDQTVSNLKNPENTPITSTVNDVVGPFLGFGITGKAGRAFDKAAREISERNIKSEYTKPEPLPTPKQAPINLGPLEFTKSESPGPATVVKSKKKTGSTQEKVNNPIYQGQALEKLALVDEEVKKAQEQLQEPGMDMSINEGAQAPIVRAMKGEQVYGVQGERTGPIEKTQDAPSMFEQSREAIANREEDRVGRLEKELTNKISAKHEWPGRTDQEAAWRMEDANDRANERLEGRKTEARLEALSNPKINHLTAQVNHIEKKLQSAQERLKASEITNKDHPLQKEARRLTRKLFGLKDSLREEMAKPSGRPNMQRSPLGGVGKKQGGAIDPSIFSEGISKLLGRGKKPQKPTYEPQGKRGIIAALGPAEPRNIDQFLDDVLPADIKEKPGYFGDLNTILNDWLPGDTTAARSAKKGGNPFVSYMNAKLNDIDRMRRTLVENALHGEGFVPNLRGWVKRVASDDGALTLFNKAARKSQENIRRVSMEWMRKSDELEAMGLNYPTEAMYAESGLSPAEIKSLRATTGQFTKLWERANELRKRDGKPPIKFKPGFFPGVWEGDFRVFVKDADNQTVQVVSAWNRFQANKIRDDLRKQFPDLKVEDPSTVRQNKYAINDTSAFQLIHEMIGDTPMGKKVMKYANDVKTHRGFNRHTLHKKGVEGSLGSAFGDVKGWQKATEYYLNSGYEWIADMERNMLKAEFEKKLKERGFNLKDELPKTWKYIDNQVANSKKAVENEIKFVDNAFAEVFDKVGLGPNTHYKVGSFLSGAASTAWLSTVKFFEMNTLQPILGAAKAYELASKFGDNPVAATAAVMKAYSKALVETYIPGMASADTKAMMTFAKKHSMIDAKFLEMTTDHLFDPSLPRKVVDTWPKHALGWWEQEVVRTPMTMAFNDILRDIITNPEERYAAAGALAESTMVNYSRTQTGRIWARTGWIGEQIKPMKQFALSSTGQLLDLTNTMIKERRPGPMLVMLAATWTLAGVKGMAPLPMINSVIGAINSVLSDDNQQKTVEQHLLESGMSDMFIFGPVSKYSSQNLTGSLAFPDPSTMLAPAGLSYAGNIAKEGINMVNKGLSGNVTEMDKMRMEMAAEPSQLREWTKERYARPGEGVPNPRTGQSDVGPRSKGESVLAKITAAEPYREGVEKAGMRGYKIDEQHSKAKQNVVKAKIINDFVMNGELNQDKIDEFVAQGGDPNNISSSITKWMVDDLINFYTRELLKAKGANSAKVKNRVDKFRFELEQATVDDLAEAWKETK